MRCLYKTFEWTEHEGCFVQTNIVIEKLFYIKLFDIFPVYYTQILYGMSYLTMKWPVYLTKQTILRENRYSTLSTHTSILPHFIQHDTISERKAIFSSLISKYSIKMLRKQNVSFRNLITTFLSFLSNNHFKTLLNSKFPKKFTNPQSKSF